MNISYKYIGFQEIPNKQTLIYHISGCSRKCPGCHSEVTWDSEYGVPFNIEEFTKHVESHREYVDGVLFMVGDITKDVFDTVLSALEIINDLGLESGIYTALGSLDMVPMEWRFWCDYIKIGAYVEKLGGLDSDNTNQILYECAKIKGVVGWNQIMGNPMNPTELQFIKGL